MAIQAEVFLRSIKKKKLFFYKFLLKMKIAILFTLFIKLFGNIRFIIIYYQNNGIIIINILSLMKGYTFFFYV